VSVVIVLALPRLYSAYAVERMPNAQAPAGARAVPGQRSGCALAELGVFPALGSRRHSCSGFAEVFPHQGFCYLGIARLQRSQDVLMLLG
jgi:hypothetical protein